MNWENDTFGLVLRMRAMVYSSKVTMFAVGNAAELYPGSTLRGCEPLAVRHSLGVFHRSGCAL